MSSLLGISSRSRTSSSNRLLGCFWPPLVLRLGSGMFTLVLFGMCTSGFLGLALGVCTLVFLGIALGASMTSVSRPGFSACSMMTASTRSRTRTRLVRTSGSGRFGGFGLRILFLGRSCRFRLKALLCLLRRVSSL